MRNRLLSACRPTATDAHLARRAAAGDDDAFGQLYVRYQPRLEAYCRSIVRHDEDARDAVQNAMTKALVALRRDHPANVQGWLFRIAHNEAVSLLRRRRPTAELADVLHDARPGPAGDLLMREELRATLDNVRALPHNLQHPLLLRELAGLSYGQVAEVVGGTPAAARKAVFDARTALSADRAGRDEACAVIRQSLSEGDGRRRRARVVRSHLQSCQSCCAWESEQRQRRYHLASLLPAATAAGTAGGWLAGLFGGGTTVAAGVTGSLATNAKVAASLAVIAAGAAPVVERVERDHPATKIGASAGPAVATAQAARRAVRAATASRASAEAAIASARGAAGTGATASRPRSARSANTSAGRDGTAPARAGDSSSAQRGAGDSSSGQRGAGDAAAGPRTDGAAGRRATGDRAGGARTDGARRLASGDASTGSRTDGAAGRGASGATPGPSRPARDATGQREGTTTATAPRPRGDDATVGAFAGAGARRPLRTTALAARPAATGASDAAARRPAGATSRAARPAATGASDAAARRPAGATSRAARPAAIGASDAAARRSAGTTSRAARPAATGPSDAAARGPAGTTSRAARLAAAGTSNQPRAGGGRDERRTRSAGAATTLAAAGRLAGAADVG